MYGLKGLYWRPCVLKNDCSADGNEGVTNCGVVATVTVSAGGGGGVVGGGTGVVVVLGSVVVSSTCSYCGTLTTFTRRRLCVVADRPDDLVTGIGWLNSDSSGTVGRRVRRAGWRVLCREGFRSGWASGAEFWSDSSKTGFARLPLIRAPNPLGPRGRP